MPIGLADSAALAGVTLVLALWFLDRKNKPPLPLPPGPKPLPLIGNVLDMPRENGHLVYREWSEKYGSDVVHANALGTNFVILNSARAVDALFNKRSAIYSDRPEMAAFKFIGIGRTLGNLSYGPELRAQRRAYHFHLSPEAVPAYELTEASAVYNLLRALLDTPADFRDHLRHMAGEVIMSVAYGIQVQEKDDPYIAMAETAMKWVSRSVQFDGLLLDMLPFLQKMPGWFPGAGFKRAAIEGKRVISEIFERPFEITKNAVAKGVAVPSVSSHMIEDDKDMELAKIIPATMYMAGADSTVSALASFFLAMRIYPDVQKKAQNELDSVLGSAGSRFPTLADAPLLPYIGALVSELLRWHPVSPLGLPHRVRQDDIYDGHFIPANSAVFANLHAILHDPSLFPDPSVFKPEHYLPRDQGGTFPDDADAPPLLRDVAFEIGRRICPGRHLARQSVWLAVVCILAVFEVLPAKDEDGKEIEVEEKYVDGLIAFPAPFACEIRVRSEAAKTLIRAASA